MASKFNGLLDSIENGILSPKGNMADWQHASRLYTDRDMALAPKTKFLYHVQFEISSEGQGILPKLFTGSTINELGMLVKRADLPKFTANIETKKKYNRVKNIQTSISYEPVTIELHDDNEGITTALLQAYYRYYFADGNQQKDSGRAYAVSPHSTYEGASRNNYKFGMDVNNPGVPFFKSIKISTLSRGEYTTYTLVNPILTGWSHDNVDNSDGAGTLQNSIQIAYEAVFYNQSSITPGANGEPVGFGQDHYDTTPSPISLEGGGKLGLGGTIGGALDLYEYIASGDAYNNPLLAVLQGAQLIGNVRNLSKEGLRQEGFNILTNAIGQAAGINVSGVAQTFFPKNSGRGGSKDLLLAAAGVGIVAAVTSSATSLRNNPAALDSARQRQSIKNFQANGGGTVAAGKAAYEAQRSNPNAMAALEKQLGI
jgi:hypothetical protein|tara:strand:+ start:405 stop:1688 length:1284 start_codon:yes stop_codon:yes gene_type:complete